MYFSHSVQCILGQSFKSCRKKNLCTTDVSQQAINCKKKLMNENEKTFWLLSQARYGKISDNRMVWRVNTLNFISVGFVSLLCDHIWFWALIAISVTILSLSHSLQLDAGFLYNKYLLGTCLPALQICILAFHCFSLWHTVVYALHWQVLWCFVIEYKDLSFTDPEQVELSWKWQGSGDQNYL